MKKSKKFLALLLAALMVLCLVPITAFAAEGDWDELVEPDDHPERGEYYADNYFPVTLDSFIGSTNDYYDPIGLIMNRDGLMDLVVRIKKNGTPNPIHHVAITNYDDDGNEIYPRYLYTDGGSYKVPDHGNPVGGIDFDFVDSYAQGYNSVVIHRPIDGGRGTAVGTDAYSNKNNFPELDYILPVNTNGYLLIHAGRITDITSLDKFRVDVIAQGSGGWSCAMALKLSLNYTLEKTVDKSPVDHGEYFTYTLKLGYDNNYILTGVNVWDKADPGVEIIGYKQLPYTYTWNNVTRTIDGTDEKATPVTIDGYTDYYQAIFNGDEGIEDGKYLVGMDLNIVPGYYRYIKVLARATGEVEDTEVTNNAWIQKLTMQEKHDSADVFVNPCTFSVMHSSDKSVEGPIRFMDLNDGETCAIYAKEQNPSFTYGGIDVVHPSADGALYTYGGVKSGYIYGGIATDETYTTPITEATACGLNMVPTTNKQVLYLREVSEAYLQPKTLYVGITYRGSDGVPQIGKYLTDTYMVTALDADGVDHSFYTEYGVVKDGSLVKAASTVATEGNGTIDKDTETFYLYKSILIDNESCPYSSDPNAEYTPSQVFGALGLTDKDSYFGCITHSIGLTDYEGFKFTPYYKTADGVLVTGIKERNIGDKGIEDRTAPLVGDTVKGSVAEKYPVAPASSPARKSMLMLSAKPAALVPGGVTDTRVTVTLVNGSEETEVKVEPGNYVGSFDVPEKAGYVFAGWFADASFKTPADFSDVTENTTAYAKFVKDSYFKANTKVAGKKITASMIVDSENYKEFGFVYSVNGEEGTAVANKLKKSGKSDKSAEVDIKDLPKKSVVEVTPYHVTLDGTVVYGNSVTANIK